MSCFENLFSASFIGEIEQQKPVWISCLKKFTKIESSFREAILTTLS